MISPTTDNLLSYSIVLRTSYYMLLVVFVDSGEWADDDLSDLTSIIFFLKNIFPAGRAEGIYKPASSHFVGKGARYEGKETRGPASGEGAGNRISCVSYLGTKNQNTTCSEVSSICTSSSISSNVYRRSTVSTVEIHSGDALLPAIFMIDEIDGISFRERFHLLHMYCLPR